MFYVFLQFVAILVVTVVAGCVGAYYLLLSPPAPVCEAREATTGRRIDGTQEGEESGEGAFGHTDEELTQPMEQGGANKLPKNNAHITVQHPLRNASGGTLSVKTDHTCRLDETAEWLNAILHYTATTLIACSASSVEARQQHRLEALEQQQLRIQQQQQQTSTTQNSNASLAHRINSHASLLGSKVSSPYMQPQPSMQSPNVAPQPFSLSGQQAPTTTTDAIMVLKLKEMASDPTTGALQFSGATPHRRTTSNGPLLPHPATASNLEPSQPLQRVQSPPPYSLGLIPKDRVVAEVLVEPLLWLATAAIQKVSDKLRSTIFRSSTDAADEQVGEGEKESFRSGGFSLILNSFSLGLGTRPRIERSVDLPKDSLPSGGALGALIVSQLPDFILGDSKKVSSPLDTVQQSPSAANVDKSGLTPDLSGAKSRPTSPMLLPDGHLMRTGGALGRSSPVPDNGADSTSPPSMPSPPLSTEAPPPAPSSHPLSTDSLAYPYIKAPIGARYSLKQALFTKEQLSSCNHTSLEAFAGSAIDQQKPLYLSLPLQYQDSKFKLDLRATAIPLLFFLNMSKGGQNSKLSPKRPLNQSTNNLSASAPTSASIKLPSVVHPLPPRRFGGASESGASSSVASYAVPYGGTSMPVLGGGGASISNPFVPRPLSQPQKGPKGPQFGLLADLITVNCSISIAGLDILANVDVRVRVLDGVQQLANELAEAPCRSYSNKNKGTLDKALSHPPIGLSEGALRLLKPQQPINTHQSVATPSLSSKIAARANFLAAASLAPRPTLVPVSPIPPAADGLISTPPATHLGSGTSFQGSPNTSHCVTSLPSHHLKAQAALESHIAKLVSAFGLTHKLLVIEITCRGKPAVKCDINASLGGKEHPRFMPPSSVGHDSTKAAEMVRLALDKALSDNITFPTAIQVCLGRRVKSTSETTILPSRTVNGPEALPPAAPMKLGTVVRKVQLSSW